MLRWLRVMSHPDGGIAFFNDAAFGIAPDIADLMEYAAALGLVLDQAPLSDSEALPDSGYIRLQAGPAVVIADVGLIGPDYLPGHAHADTLSFELSLFGQRVMVNGGTSTYETNAARLLQRGTAMHNTVMVDGADSSEVWSSFRVARRARPLDVQWGREGEVRWIEAGHDGYRRLPGQVTHRRRWMLEPDRLRVVDQLNGKYREANAAFRFGPGLPVDLTASNVGRAGLDEHTLHWQTEGALNIDVRPGFWHPRFGASEGCQVLVVTFTGTTLETEIHWH